MEAQPAQAGITPATSRRSESSTAANFTGAAADDVHVTHNNSSDVSSTTISNANCFNCCICQEDHPNENIATVNGCAHSFCFKCIDEWTTENRSCPLCRKAVAAIIIHQVTFPVKRPKLKIEVRNTRGWHRNFFIHRNMKFINPVLDIYAPRNPVRAADGAADYRYNTDVVFYHNDSRIADENATAKKIGMKDGDIVWIRHKVTVLFNMPDSNDLWDMIYETNWWDTSLGEFIQTYFDKLELDSNDYWIIPPFTV